MCIAILKTRKGIITDEQLKNCFKNNSDGAGIAYTKNNKLKVVKGIFDVETFIKTVRQAEKLCDNNMLIHCRIGTSGLLDKDNTHPFWVNNRVCMIHNGILDIVVPKNSKKSDTAIFVDKILSKVTHRNLMHNKDYAKLLQTFIGSNNKFVLMDNKGYYRIINEDAGHWENDVWYSNYSYEPKKFVTNYFSKYITNGNMFYSGYYNSYDDYEDYDEYYPKEDEFTPDCVSDKDKEDILETIYNLNIKEFEYLGDNPKIEPSVLQLIPESAEFGIPLQEYSDEIYDTYLEMREIVQDDIYNVREA